MNNNIKRLGLGTLIAFLVLTAFFVLLEKTSLVIIAYCAGMIAVVELAGTLYLLASGTKNQYIQNTAFPLVSWSYLKWNLFVSIVVAGLELSKTWVMPYGWFIFIHILLIAVFAWRLLAMDAGKEKIEAVEKEVKTKTFSWKSLELEAQKVLQKSGPNCKPVEAVCEAIRYADPMTDEMLEACSEEILLNLQKLAVLAESDQTEEMRKLSEIIQVQIRTRNAKCKLLKS